MTRLKILFLLIFCLSMSLFAANDDGIFIDRIYEKSLSPNGKLAIARVVRGENEDGVYIINTETKNLISAITPLSSDNAARVDIAATWNHTLSKVAILMHYGRIMVALELFELGSDGQFKQTQFNYPKEIEHKNKLLQENQEIFHREDICGLGNWVDDNTVALIAGRLYQKNDGDINYLTSFNIHITPAGKAVLQKVKVIGSLTDKEYDAFVAKYNYQF